MSLVVMLFIQRHTQSMVCQKKNTIPNGKIIDSFEGYNGKNRRTYYLFENNQGLWIFRICASMKGSRYSEFVVVISTPEDEIDHNEYFNHKKEFLCIDRPSNSV